MRKANIYVADTLAGTLTLTPPAHYVFQYLPDYSGPPISLTMPVQTQAYEYHQLPPFFDGLLPEGAMLEGLLKQHKIDRDDYFSQLATVGDDLVGAISFKESLA